TDEPVMSVIERLSTTTVTFRDRWLRLGRIARYTTWLEWPEPDIVLALLLGSVVVGCAGVLATSAIGSGDYGQWLMTSRSYLGVGIPAYRAGGCGPVAGTSGRTRRMGVVVSWRLVPRCGRSGTYRHQRYLVAERPGGRRPVLPRRDALVDSPTATLGPNRNGAAAPRRLLVDRGAARW